MIITKSDLSYLVQGVMLMYCDNQVAIFIMNDSTFHLRTMHIKIVCHFIRY
ncbi:unnamed protein product [Spirodela intermedia]|uniref:Uncharacterized protein n=1 Tax=Spirodela intermedia TaxID=51605 RepID=A0A7I8L630_SPIIN|nr:unnamed protein product [Spirodela intermedia]